MSTNFQFLKKVNNNLYEIISDAEKLYRDEYFEQCMAQTRRFGEQMCKTMLEENGEDAGTFDSMLSVLQNRSQGSVQEKEFLEDLYFLKKNGNSAVHSSSVKKDAMTALECLKRAFETAINYSVYTKGAPSSILKLRYDIELLVSGKKSDSTLYEKYEETKKNQICPSVEHTVENKLNKKQINIKISIFWKLIICLSIISFLIISLLSISIAVKKFFVG